MGFLRAFGPKRWVLAYVLTLLLVGSLGACGTTSGSAEGDSGDTERVVTQAPITAEELAVRLGLRVETLDRYGRLYLAGRGTDRVLLVPDTTVVSVRGRGYEAVSPIRERHGSFWIGAEDAVAIESIWRMSDPAPDRATPVGDRPRPAPTTGADFVLPPPPPPIPTAQPTPVRRASGLVVLDAGHGGKDPGAPGRVGVPEKTVVLDVSRRIAARLRDAGVQVVLTREDDVFVELNKRAEVGNRSGAALFVSVHADSAESTAAQGFSVYVNRDKVPAGARSASAAKAILAEMRKTGARDRGLKRAGYRVLKRSRGPAVLVELGFMSNYSESRRLVRPVYRQKMADAVAEGIVRFLGGR